MQLRVALCYPRIDLSEVANTALFLSSINTTQGLNQMKARANNKLSWQRFNDKNKKRVSIENETINRKAVLSSGRALPSAKRGMALQYWDLANQAHSMHEIARKDWDENYTRTQEQYENLKKKYKNNPEALKENPKAYTLPKRLRSLRARLIETEELFTHLAATYKRVSGEEWKPKLEVYKPIDGIQKRFSKV